MRKERGLQSKIELPIIGNGRAKKRGVTLARHRVANRGEGGGGWGSAKGRIQRTVEIAP